MARDQLVLNSNITATKKRGLNFQRTCFSRKLFRVSGSCLQIEVKNNPSHAACNMHSQRMKNLLVMTLLLKLDLKASSNCQKASWFLKKLTRLGLRAQAQARSSSILSCAHQSSPSFEKFLRRFFFCATKAAKFEADPKIRDFFLQLSTFYPFGENMNPTFMTSSKKTDEEVRDQRIASNSRGRALATDLKDPGSFPAGSWSLLNQK